jgi:hypothetical protein
LSTRVAVGVLVSREWVYGDLAHLSPIPVAGMSNPNLTQLVLSRLPPLHCGQVWLVGAGPGDPGPLTMYALAGLTQADVVVHDALVSTSILDLAAPNARRVFAGERGGRASVDQADIIESLIEFCAPRIARLAAQRR